MKVETEGEELVMKKGEWGDGIGNEERGRGGGRGGAAGPNQ